MSKRDRVLFKLRAKCKAAENRFLPALREFVLLLPTDVQDTLNVTPASNLTYTSVDDTGRSGHDQSKQVRLPSDSSTTGVWSGDETRKVSPMGTLDEEQSLHNISDSGLSSVSTQSRQPVRPAPSLTRDKMKPVYIHEEFKMLRMKFEKFNDENSMLQAALDDEDPLLEKIESKVFHYSKIFDSVEKAMNELIWIITRATGEPLPGTPDRWSSRLQNPGANSDFVSPTAKSTPKTTPSREESIPRVEGITPTDVSEVATDIDVNAARVRPNIVQTDSGSGFRVVHRPPTSDVHGGNVQANSAQTLVMTTSSLHETLRLTSRPQSQVKLPADPVYPQNLVSAVTGGDGNGGPPDGGDNDGSSGIQGSGGNGNPDGRQNGNPRPGSGPPCPPGGGDPSGGGGGPPGGGPPGSGPPGSGPPGGGPPGGGGQPSLPPDFAKDQAMNAYRATERMILRMLRTVEEEIGRTESWNERKVSRVLSLLDDAQNLLDNDLRKCYEKLCLVDPVGITTYSYDFNQFQDEQGHRIVTFKMRIISLETSPAPVSATPAPIVNEPAQTQANMDYRHLPRLDNLHFSGKVEDWPEFRRNWLARYGNFRENVQIQYLRPALPVKDQSKITALTSMSECWQRLEKTYGNRTLNIVTVKNNL